jgi:6-phosphogluconolactonase
MGGCTTIELKVYADLNELSRAAAAEFVRLACNAVQAKGMFTVALSGGSTPRALYELLGGELLSKLPCNRMHFFWGDERFVSADDPENNYRAANEAMLSKLNVSAANIHRIPTEASGARQAAEQYEQELRAFFRLSPGELPRFDLMLLGLGGDGHTASLFPGTSAPVEKEKLVVDVWIEKLHASRITLTPPVFNHAVNVIFLVAGADKAATLHSVLKGTYEPDRFPAQVIRPPYGRLVWMVDRAAAGK